MSERLLTLDEVPDRGAWIVVGDQQTAIILLPDEVPAIAAELDRLYAAAEANQAPGPDWKAKLRQDVGARRHGWFTGGAAIEWVLSAIDALPDPPTPDPDAPPVYVPPEGHVAPVLGRDVPDGWEGRVDAGFGNWWGAAECRNSWGTYLFEVRRVPAPEPATEWVPLTKLVGRTIKGEAVKVHAAEISTHCDPLWWALHDLAMDHRAFPDGTLDLDTAQVLVLAEGERS